VATSWANDAEDDDTVWLASVLDDVVSEVVRTDARLATLNGMPDVWNSLNEIEGVVQNVFVATLLIATPCVMRVLKNFGDVSERPSRVSKTNT
jgi:hypothetical protein